MNASELPAHRYDAALANEIESRWQAWWDEQGVYEAPNPTGPLRAGVGSPSESVAVSAESGGDPEVKPHEASRPKLFIMDMFPYPSGSGLHVGHPLGYIATDVYARFKRMTGFNVLHTMGFDSFGLPAEEHARQTGTHPRDNTEANIANMTRQLDRLGLGHDKRRVIATSDPAYYRWTQWIFLQIFNSWFDPTQNRTRPIAELPAEFEAGTREAPGALSWSELDEASRRRVVDGHRLAYLDEATVNWCPALGTVLSNEEVTAEGRSERGNHPVYRRPLEQWMLRITAYADRLLADLDLLDWSDSIKTMQRNWIGRSEGAVISFPVTGSVPAGSDPASSEHGRHLDLAIEVFTTRPDTVFGATFMVLAPTHPLVDLLTADSWPVSSNPLWTGGAATPAQAVARYRAAANKSPDADPTGQVAKDQEATDQVARGQASKTAVYLGCDALVPVDGRRIPVFIADYVLMGYGTGAIMGVPGEDERDWEMAETFELPIVRTVQPPADHPSGEAYLGDGVIINSGFLDGLDAASAKTEIISWLETTGSGRGTVTYKLRDWLFSRQRYWGEPFPIVFDPAGLPVAVPEADLPVVLPDLMDWAPRALAEDSDPEPPLGRVTEWTTIEVSTDDGAASFRREINTMPQWAGSCWYYLRYLDPTNSDALVDPEVERYWMSDPSPGGVGGVDLYVGGVEHAVLHLLYARFWHKILYDLGHVSGPEPFKRLINQGYITAAAYRDHRGVYVDSEEVTTSPNGDCIHAGRVVTRSIGKMGKSLKNAVTPDDMYLAYGADTMRLYEMSMGPIDQDRPWETRSVVGSQRLLQRVWRNLIDEQTGEPVVADAAIADDLARLLHRTIAGVRTDMDGLRFNTAIAKLTELNNELTRLAGPTPRELAQTLVKMLAPLVPHFAEELWQRLGGSGSVTLAAFPEADPALLAVDSICVPVQVNGKVRGRVTIPADADEAAALASALELPNVIAHVDGCELRRSSYVPGRIITLVV